MADRRLIRLSQVPERLAREKLEDSDWVTFAVLVSKATPQSNSSVGLCSSLLSLVVTLTFVFVEYFDRYNVNVNVVMLKEGSAVYVTVQEKNVMRCPVFDRAPPVCRAKPSASGN